MTELFDDLPDPPRTDPGAVKAAEREVGKLMRTWEAACIAEGWELTCKMGEWVNVWKRADGKYVAQVPGKVIEL